MNLCRSGLILLSLVLGGCVNHPYEPTPRPIAAEEVFLRNSLLWPYGYMQWPRCEVLVVEANGRSALRSQFTHPWPHRYPVPLPAGRNTLAILVTLGGETSRGGVLEDWEVDLPGGREYVLLAAVRPDFITVWIEDADTLEVVTERRELGLVDRDEIHPYD